MQGHRDDPERAGTPAYRQSVSAAWIDEPGRGPPMSNELASLPLIFGWLMMTRPLQRQAEQSESGIGLLPAIAA
jgi:hypothetical protein